MGVALSRTCPGARCGSRSFGICSDLLTTAWRSLCCYCFSNSSLSGFCLGWLFSLFSVVMRSLILVSWAVLATLAWCELFSFWTLTVIIICPRIWQMVMASLRFYWRPTLHPAGLCNEEMYYLMEQEVLSQDRLQQWSGDLKTSLERKPCFPSCRRCLSSFSWSSGDCQWLYSPSSTPNSRGWELIFLTTGP